MLPGAPDNVDVSPEGKVFVAVFPDIREILDYFTQQGAKRPSSAVVELVPKLDRMSWRTTPDWARTSGPLDPSPGNGPAGGRRSDNYSTSSMKWRRPAESSNFFFPGVR